MSAELTEASVYSWYCAECGDGGADYPDEYPATADMEEHNEEQHGGA